MTLDNFASVFKNRKVLVTGHTGFKGSWLSIWLNLLEASVSGFSLTPETNPNNYDLSRLDQKVASYIGDIRDFSAFKKVLEKQCPEIIFHLAAQPLVRFSYREPQKTYETNVMGLVNLFEAVREIESVKVVLVITTDKCYENKEWVWGYRETDELGGHDPYSASKACAEIISASYRRSFFNSPERKVLIATARAGNVIGGGDWSLERIIPDLIVAIQRNTILEIRNPSAVRPWQHVLEPLAGYLKLVAALIQKEESYEGAWNFGPGKFDVLCVEDLVKYAQFRWGTGLNYCINPAKNNLHETSYLFLDSSKAFHKLNWKTIFDTRQAITMTIDWYKAFYQSGSDAYELCCNQIMQYIELAHL